MGNYILNDIDLAQFPKEIKLSHGREGEREWWEWWNNSEKRDKKGIVIQRPNQQLPFVIFFEQGEAMRTLELPLTEADKQRGVVSKPAIAFTVDGATKILGKLGIKAVV